jgi:hypothetical protein
MFFETFDNRCILSVVVFLYADGDFRAAAIARKSETGLRGAIKANRGAPLAAQTFPLPPPGWTGGSR